VLRCTGWSSLTKERPDRRQEQEKTLNIGPVYDKRMTNGDASASMIAGSHVGRARTEPCWRLIAVAVCSVLIALTIVELAMAAPAGASPAPKSAPSPTCPPDCGRVAAGDPLLVRFMTNPGLGWDALPDTRVESYAHQLKQSVTRAAKGTVTNVAVAQWYGATGGYRLLIVLVSSSSLKKLHLANPTNDAQDLCSSFHGFPVSKLVRIPGVPTALSGQCVFPGASSANGKPAGATIVAFTRADVATLIEITSQTPKPIALGTATSIAYLQYEFLPAAGVPVSSNGLDLGLVLVWLAILAAVLFGVVASARRRGTWHGPLEATVQAFGRRKLALGVSLVGVIGAVAFAMTDSAVLHGAGAWYNTTFTDFWETWATSADSTFAGGYGHIYLLDRALETAPAVEVVFAPIARIAFHLSFPLQGLVVYPKAFLIAAPLYLSAMALPICAADRLLSYIGVTDVRRRVIVLGTMAVTLPTPALGGHPEDLVALGAMLYGLVAALEERPRAVGWWLGTALAFQFLAFLAVPIALVLLKRRQWLGAVVPMVLVPLSVLLVPLISAPTATVSQLVHQKVFDVLGNITPIWNLDPGAASFVRGLIALAAIPAAVVVARILPEDRRAAANLVVWVLALLFALRAFEPELPTYFLAPALALPAISASQKPWWRLACTCAGAIWLTWWLHEPVQARWSQWLFLLAQLGVLGWLAMPRRRRPSADLKSPVRRRVSAPLARNAVKPAAR
jgi:hypothetical protein